MSLLFTALFLFHGNNHDRNHCCAADSKQHNPQDHIAVIARLRSLGVFRLGLLLQPRGYGIRLRNLLGGLLIGIILAAAVAEPIRDIAFC